MSAPVPDSTSDSSKVHRGLRWSSLSLVGTQGVRFVTTAILAHLLAKEVFGVIMVANAVILVLIGIREMGLGQAYIQRRSSSPEEEERSASTSFWLTLAINGALFFVVFFLSPFFSHLFQDADQEEVGRVLRTLFLVFWIDPVISIATFVLHKRLEFGRHAFSEILGAFANAAFAIPLAFMGMGVWSLVAGQLGARVVQAGLLLKLSGWYPRFLFDGTIARELFAYGKYLWGFSIISAMGQVFDRLVIAKLLGAASVGVYGLAFNLCTMAATQISTLVNRVAFPALSRLQHDLPALDRAFRKALGHVAILSAPIALGLVAVARSFVLVVYGEEWLGMVPIIEVLAFHGMTVSISSISGPVVKALGRPRVMLVASIVHQGVLFPLVYLIGPYGIVYVAWAVLAPLVLSTFIAFQFVYTRLPIRVVDLLSIVGRPVIAALIMFACVKSFQLIWAPSLSPLMELLGSIATGIPSYLVATLVVNRPVCEEFFRTMGRVSGVRGGCRSDVLP